MAVWFSVFLGLLELHNFPRLTTQLRRRHDEWTDGVSLLWLKVDDNQDKCLLLIPHRCQKFGDVAFFLTAGERGGGRGGSGRQSDSENKSESMDHL